MLAELKADLARYPGGPLQQLGNALQSAAFYPILVYRLGHDVYFRWPRLISLAARIPYKLAAFLAEWATGIYIAPSASIGPGLYIGHWGCTRIGREVRLGSNCNVSPMVFIGFGAMNGKTGVPTLGDRVYVAAGAKIIGPVRVGSDVTVGANAVVCRDVPEHVTVGGVPARILSNKGSGPYIQVGQKIDVKPASDSRAVSDDAEQEAAMQPRRTAVP